MENTQTGLLKLTKPIGFNESTGMSVYNSYTSTSGFNYMIGVRESNDLLIVEQIAEGVACTYLCGIRIFHRNDNVLLKEILVPRYFNYSRLNVMNLVNKALMEMLIESAEHENKFIDMENAQEFVNDMLDKCYFETSRKTIIEWAKMVGIINE